MRIFGLAWLSSSSAERVAIAEGPGTGRGFPCDEAVTISRATSPELMLSSKVEPNVRKSFVRLRQCLDITQSVALKNLKVGCGNCRKCRPGPSSYLGHRHS